MPATYYPAILDRSASGFGASFVDFPGCIAAGETASEAALNAEAALAMHVEAMVKDKDELPLPSSLDELEKQDGDVATVLVRVDTPVKVERVLVSIDSNLLRAIDAVASNRSAFMADAARAHLASTKARIWNPSFEKHLWCMPEPDAFENADLLNTPIGPAYIFRPTAAFHQSDVRSTGAVACSFATSIPKGLLRYTSKAGSEDS